MYTEKKICQNCGEEFHITSNGSRGQFCSVPCYNQFRKANPGYYRKHALLTIKCAACGKEFTRRKHEVRSELQYCSKKCANSVNGRKRSEGRSLGKITKICEECGKEYTVSYSHGQRRRFCGRTCEQANRSKNLRGENNPNYRHGKNRLSAKWTALRWYPTKCAICGFDIAVEIHHIRPIAKDGTNDIDNLIVLCPNHHAMAGRNMFTDEQLKDAAKAVRFVNANNAP